MNAGETLVISGLLDKQSAKDTEKLAGLGDIPILGTFFRNNNVNVVDRELVIFVTPTVYDAHSELNQAYIRRRQENIDAFDAALEKRDFLILE